jgi:hypothetical protein
MRGKSREGSEILAVRYKLRGLSKRAMCRRTRVTSLTVGMNTLVKHEDFGTVEAAPRMDESNGK